MPTYRVHYMYEDHSFVDVEADSPQDAEEAAHGFSWDAITEITDVHRLEQDDDE